MDRIELDDLFIHLIIHYDFSILVDKASVALELLRAMLILSGERLTCYMVSPLKNNDLQLSEDLLV